MNYITPAYACQLISLLYRIVPANIRNFARMQNVTIVNFFQHLAKSLDKICKIGENKRQAKNAEEVADE